MARTGKDVGVINISEWVLCSKNPAAQNLIGQYLSFCTGDFESPRFASEAQI